MGKSHNISHAFTAGKDRTVQTSNTFVQGALGVIRFRHLALRFFLLHLIFDVCEELILLKKQVSLPSAVFGLTCFVQHAIPESDSPVNIDEGFHLCLLAVHGTL